MRTVNDAGLLSWPENQAHSIKSDDENDDPNGEDGIETVYEQEEMTMSRKDSLYSRAKGDSEENDTEREEEHKNSTSEDDSNERHDDKNEDESEENDDGDDDDDNNNSEDSQQTRSPWSRLTASFRRQRKDKDNTAAARVRPASTPHHHRPKSSTKTIVSISGVDESQIPEVTEVAMDAVLEYMAEILAPGLVIHQLTEAIQSALYQIKKTTKNQAAAIGTKKSGYLSGDMARLGWDMDALERMTSGLGKHSHNIDSEDNGSLELLGDNWFLSGADADNSRSQDDEDDGEGPNSDELLLGLQESEDEDIWSDGSDEIDWDKPGHLFDDLAEESNTEVFSTLDPPISKSPRSSRASSGEDEQVELDGGISSSNGDEDEGEDGDETVSDSFSVGIRNEDDPYEDIGNSDDDADGMVESSEDYNRDTAPFSVKKPQKAFNYPDNHPELFERLRQRFQKRFLVAAASSSGSISSQASSTHPFRIDSVTESAYRSFDKRSRADTVNGRSQHSAGISIASDPRLEDLLTQLIKPLLVSFVDEDFPESCRRFQGELMDSIILALDQLGSSSSGNGLSEEDQILLFAELGY
ncbi:hypothetical protein BGW38_001385 [Lunasporangiospora selenospora]|uniref:Uncharacterized protein n=1 Tax=Lunasporangiospora selenospora TaxID=979761 RepID=A0A9P6FVP2_9FUNG|nr:hypothetical protein BGW38_001385 [Lunasporangiospora selenospora]